MDAARTLARGQQRLERAAQRLDRAAGQLVSPAQRLEHQRERLNSLGFRLRVRLVRAARRAARASLARATPGTSQARHAPRARPNAWRTPRGNWARPTRGCACRRATGWLPPARALRALDPGNTLARGYAIARDAQGRILRDAASLQPGQALELRFARGGAQAEVTEVRPESDAS